MYWSIYDTLVLVSGLIAAAIAVIPLPEIPTKTRATAGLVGGGLVVISLILGNLPSFTYPSIVMIGPVIALVVAGLIVKTALDDRKRRESASSGHPAEFLQYGEAGTQVGAPVAPNAAAATVPVHPATSVVDVPPRPPLPTPAAAEPSRPATLAPRDQAWAELFDVSTSAERLAQIAQEFPEFAAQIGAHPNAYDTLKAWAASVGGAQ